MATENEQLEQDMIQIEDWLGRMDETKKVGPIDRDALDRVLNSLGAELEVDEGEEASLRKYTNLGSRKGMAAVWGEDRMVSFSKFCGNFVSAFESFQGNLELPKLDSSGSKTSGMKQFFHELTSFAYGIMTYEDFALFTETRLTNGMLWQQGKKDERLRVATPTSGGKKILISSVPGSFVTTFWGWLKASSQK